MPSRRGVIFGMGCASLTGCAALVGPSRRTMDVIRDDGGCSRTLSRDVLVLLPGANMAPIELVQRGFVAAVRQRGLPLDLALPDAHLGYAYDGSMMTRLHDDVIAPAIVQGRRRVWLAGISLGGYVALGYAQQHPQQIAGVLAIAPYLGRRELLQQITAAGGPAIWRRSAQPKAPDDIDHRLWMALSDPQRQGPPLWLAYGRDDRLAEGHRLLAALLPAERVSSVPGGHDWAPWRTLWADWLDRGPLSASAASDIGACG